jgi:cytochrome c oxidase cbb3-type subunit 4
VISGIITAVLLVAFIGIFWWAYAPRRKQRFAEAAALALVDDEPSHPRRDEVTP